jgi:hypothetical protein
MFARVMSGQMDPGEIDRFTSMIEDDVIPAAEKLAGFEGGYWLADRESGSVIGVTMFKSEEALRQSAARAERIREDASRNAGLPVPSFKSYEVVASTGSEKLRRAA